LPVMRQSSSPGSATAKAAQRRCRADCRATAAYGGAAIARHLRCKRVPADRRGGRGCCGCRRERHGVESDQPMRQTQPEKVRQRLWKVDCALAFYKLVPAEAGDGRSPGRSSLRRSIEHLRQNSVAASGGLAAHLPGISSAHGLYPAQDAKRGSGRTIRSRADRPSGRAERMGRCRRTTTRRRQAMSDTIRRSAP